MWLRNKKGVRVTTQGKRRARETGKGRDRVLGQRRESREAQGGTPPKRELLS